jgi:hypothetical protein
VVGSIQTGEQKFILPALGFSAAAMTCPGDIEAAGSSAIRGRAASR